MPQFDNIINPTTSYDIIEDNGTPLPARLILNFVSPDVSIVDDVANSRTNVIFPAYVHIAGSTMTGNLILNGDPTLPLQAATKQYVDSLAGGLTPITAVKYASTGAYTATYNNGASGVGATLTNAAAMAAFSIDGFTPSVNDRVLIKDQAAQAQNGIYTVTTVGSGAVNWVLTRATDYDTSSKIKTGTYTIASAGTMNSGVLYIMTTSGTITVGTTAIVWSPFESAANITVTAPLTKVGNVLGITTPLDPSYGGTGIANSSADTITLGGVINTGGDFITTPGNPITLTTTGSTNVTLPTTGTLVNTAVTTLSSLASIGTITTGVWNGTIISPTYGGTGINNGSKTITIGGNFSTTGANTLNFTTTGNTSLTLPTSGTLMVGSNNLSELTNTTTARANLGLGTAATHAATDFLQAANNLSDVASASTSRTNLGLGTMATQNANAVAITGGTLSGVTITTPRIVTSLLDSNGNTILGFNPVANAVNYLYINNVAAGSGNPGLNASGTDANVDINFVAKGTGFISCFSPANTTVLALVPNLNTNLDTLYFDIPTITGARTATWPDASGTVAYTQTTLQTTNNLSDLSNKATARSNLGVDVCLYQVKRQIITSSGTYTPTSGMVFADVEIVGGGGGGGGAATTIAAQSAAAAGGGYGGYSKKLFTAAQIGVSQTVTIGALGAGGAAGNNAGSSGGDTTFGALLTSTGGTGGQGAGSIATSATSGGAGGNGSSGDINVPGDEGFGGFGIGSLTFTKSGEGATGIYGSGGGDRILTVAAQAFAGLPATGYGAGGGGAATVVGGTQQKGGDGVPGLCIVTEYIKRG